MTPNYLLVGTLSGVVPAVVLGGYFLFLIPAHPFDPLLDLPLRLILALAILFGAGAGRVWAIGLKPVAEKVTNNTAKTLIAALGGIFGGSFILVSFMVCAYLVILFSIN